MDQSINEDLTEKFVRVYGQYFGIVLGLIVLIAVGLSVHHDDQWNNYVDNRFNLNFGTRETKLNARDYMDITSQHEWIELIQRGSELESIVIFFVIVTTCLKFVYIMATSFIPDEIKRQTLNPGGLLFLLSAFLDGTSGVLIITSLVAADDDANHVMELIHSPKTDWVAAKKNITFGYEVDLYLNVYCDTHEHKWAAPKQCQLTYAKILATIFALVNAINSLAVAFMLFHNDFDQVRVQPAVPISLGVGEHDDALIGNFEDGETENNYSFDETNVTFEQQTKIQHINPDLSPFKQQIQYSSQSIHGSGTRGQLSDMFGNV